MANQGPSYSVAMTKDSSLQRSVFRWVQAEDEASGRATAMKLHAQITANEVALQYGVPEEALVKHIRGQISEAESCQSLPFTLLMVASYTMMVIQHDPVVPINAVEGSMMFDIEMNANFAYSSPWIGHKKMKNVNSIADFWSWMNLGLVPLTFIQERTWAEGREEDVAEDPRLQAATYFIPREDRGFILHWNRMVGGMRVRQERGEEQSCSTLNMLHAFYGRPCVGGLGYELFPDLWVAKSSNDPQREFWLYAHDDVSTIYNTIRQKEVEDWLDAVTVKIEIAIPIFNGQYGVHSIIFVNFYMSRGGHIWKRVVGMSTYSVWFHGIWNVIPDVLWLWCLLWIGCAEVFKAHQVYSTSGAYGLRHEYLSFWNLADIASVFVGCWIVYGYFNRFQNTNSLNAELEVLADISEETQRAAYREQAAKFLDMLEAEVNEAHIFRVVLGIYPMLIVLRLFKAFAAQPRLSLVTKTLGSAAVDLLHFLLVFSSIFMTYAIAGVVLFGREVDGFTNLTRATATCFRAMMGDFNWEELLKVGRFEAGLWFVSFMVVIVLLMLNMLLAIVMDSYAEQKQRLGDAETLWQEFKQAIHRWKGQRDGSLVSMKEVIKSIRNASSGSFKIVQKSHSTHLMRGHSGPQSSSGSPQLRSQYTFGSKMDLGKDDSFSLVRVKALLEVCPKMVEAQAEDLISLSILEYYKDNKEKTNTEEMLRIIRKVNYSTKKLKKYMKQSLGSKDAEGENKEEEQKRASVLSQGSAEVKPPGLPSFSDELEICRRDLRQAQEWIAEEELGMAPAEADPNQVDGAGIAEGHADDVDHGKAKDLYYEPLEGLEEAPTSSVRRIIPDRDLVLQACRNAHISSENDHLRIQALGKTVRVLETDTDDRTVKVRAPGIVRDIWFALGALSYISPQERSEAGTARTHARSSTASEALENDEAADAEALRKVQELEAELRVGRQTVSEALNAVTDLEGQLAKQREEKGRIATKFSLLKRKVVALTRENKKLLSEARMQDERLGVVGSSKDEYYELVGTLSKENDALKSKLAFGAQRPALEDRPRDQPLALHDRSRARSARGERHGRSHNHDHHRSQSVPPHRNGHGAQGALEDDRYGRGHRNGNGNGWHDDDRYGGGYHNGNGNGSYDDDRHGGGYRNGNGSYDDRHGGGYRNGNGNGDAYPSRHYR